MCNLNRVYIKMEGVNLCLMLNEELNICFELNNILGGIFLSDEDEKIILLKKWIIDDCKLIYGNKVYFVSLLCSLFLLVRIIKDIILLKRNNKVM